MAAEPNSWATRVIGLDNFKENETSDANGERENHARQNNKKNGTYVHGFLKKLE
jgi:hypothetical protein